MIGVPVKRKIVASLSAVGAGVALALAAPLAASATTYWSANYPSMSACLAEQHKAAYNNSFVRVSIPCHQGINGYWFGYTARDY
jgi:hypothetical protein